MSHTKIKTSSLKASSEKSLTIVKKPNKRLLQAFEDVKHRRNLKTFPDVNSLFRDLNK